MKKYLVVLGLTAMLALSVGAVASAAEPSYCRLIGVQCYMQQ